LNILIDSFLAPLQWTAGVIGSSPHNHEVLRFGWLLVVCQGYD